MKALDSWERLVRQGIDTSVAFARDLSDLGARYYESVLVPWGAKGADEPAWWPASGPNRQPIDATGVIGENATATFVVGPFRRSADVSFLISDIVSDATVSDAIVSDTTVSDATLSDATGASFRADMALTPLRFSLAPGEKRDVTVAVSLDPKRFEAGCYHADIVVRGGDETEFDLRITAEAPEAPAAPKTTRTRRT